MAWPGRSARVAARTPLVLALLVAGLACVFAFPLLAPATREGATRWWAGALLRACGVRLREHPAAGGRRLAHQHGACLLLANHQSWLDVFLIMALAPARFVAKSEVAHWPVLGVLVARAGTLFVERGRRHAVQRLNGRIEQALGEGQRVAVFPEGTTGGATGVLPFHGNLIEPALRAGVPVIPVALRYVDGDGNPSDAAAFVGDMTVVHSLVRVLGARGIVAEVHPLEPVAGGTRQELAARAREAIAMRIAAASATGVTGAAGAVGGTGGGL